MILIFLSNRPDWTYTFICIFLAYLLPSGSSEFVFCILPLFSSVKNIPRENQSIHLREETHVSQDHISSEGLTRRKKTYGGILDVSSLQMLEEKRDISCPLSYVLHNTKPVGHQVYISTLSEASMHG